MTMTMLKLYELLRSRGVVKSKIEFSIEFLGRGPNYLATIGNKASREAQQNLLRALMARGLFDYIEGAQALLSSPIPDLRRGDEPPSRRGRAPKVLLETEEEKRERLRLENRLRARAWRARQRAAG